jgi:hypothetical protein
MIEKIRLSIPDIERVIREGKYQEGNILEIDLRGAKKIHPELERILFKPDGYIHGKDQKAISGTIVGPNGEEIIKAYLKVQKINHPSDTTWKLLLPGVHIAENGNGTRRATIQVDVGHDLFKPDRRKEYETYVSEYHRIIVAKELVKKALSPRERILAKIKGEEKLGDVKRGNVGARVYDYLWVPKNKKLWPQWWFGWTDVAFRILPPEEEFKPEERSGEDRNPWKIARMLDDEELKEVESKLRATGRRPKVVQSIKKKIKSYDRRYAAKSKYDQEQRVINIAEARIAMIRAILDNYVRMLRNTNKNTINK